MSTVSVTNVKNASSSVNNAVTTSGGDLTNAAGVSFMGGSKNLLYNGAMQVAQRGTSSSAGIAIDGYYTADRWRSTTNSMGLYTQTLETDAPAGSGLRNSFKVLCTSADSSPAAGDYTAVEQRIEGQDLQRVAKGTASAQQLTLSFWIKSNATGTYVVNLWDLDNSRLVAATYTVSASATWEKKTITFPADTTGAFDNDNALSLRLWFYLGAGSDRTSGTLATSWASYTAANAAVGQVNLAAATNNYWQITGTQLEIGPVATSFEFEPYETTLRKCQRYYQKKSATIAGDVYFWTGLCAQAISVRGPWQLPVTMRIIPSLEISSFSHFYTYDGTAFNVVTGQNGSGSTAGHPDCPYINFTTTGMTVGRAGQLLSNNASAWMAWTAEL